MKPRSARAVWPPAEALDFPADLIEPRQDESHVAYFRTTPKPFVFLHSSHLPAGTVTGSHSHPCLALHGCLQGPLILASAAAEHTFDAGTFFLVAPGVRHYWRVPGPHVAAHLSVLIDHRHPGNWPASSGVKECCGELLRLVKGMQRFNAASDPDLKQAYWQVADYLMAEKPRKPLVGTGSLLALLGRAAELLAADKGTRLVSGAATPSGAGKVPDAETSRVPLSAIDPAEQIRRVLLARVSDRLSLEEVANEVCLSPTRAKQVFREAFGCGIMAYFNQLKIWQAKRLLGGSSLTVEQVSRKLGFSSASYFSRAFQRYTGESPKEFRSQSETGGPMRQQG